MKTIEVKTNKYQCEICGDVYDDEETAKQCESQGQSDMPDDIKIGEKSL